MRKELEDLRKLMRNNRIDCYLIPSDDPHFSEYVNAHYRAREFVSGFTGSAGTLLVTMDEAFLWTDGRYFLQAEIELAESGIELMRMGEKDTPSIKEKIETLSKVTSTTDITKVNSTASASSSIADDAPTSKDFTVGFDGNVVSAGFGQEISEIEHVTSIVHDKDLASDIWPERPELASSDIREFPLTSSGESFGDKLARIRDTIQNVDSDTTNTKGVSNAEAHGRNIVDSATNIVLLLTDLTEIAWLFNLRGSDIENTPVFYSYAIISNNDCVLMTLPGALTGTARQTIRDSAKVTGAGKITLLEYTEDEAATKVAQAIRTLANTGANTEGESDNSSSRITDSDDWSVYPSVMLDANKTSYSLYSAIPDMAAIVYQKSPVELMKAVKNDTEIAATVNAHLKDAAAVTKLIYHIKKRYGILQGADDEAIHRSSASLTEMDVADKLEELRRAQEDCFDLSFPTISAYGAHGAIIHYEPTLETNAEILPEGFLLLDSGGQYIDGTTDITRTIAVGPLTEKMKEYYTLVLKSHIALASAEFPEGTTGHELDKIARKPLLVNGLDYAHGTGHGVGHVLSVHEGPNYISKMNSDQPILPGMITSNEPGVYIEDEFGIRLENEILCETACETETAPEWPIAEDSPKRDNTVGSDEASADVPDIASPDRDGSASPADPAHNIQHTLRFRTLTTVPLERDAILPELLTKKELLWLNEYNQHIRNALMLLLEPDEAAWLMDVTMPYNV